MPPYETDESGVNRARASARSQPMTTAVAAASDRFERKRHLRPAFAASLRDPPNRAPRNRGYPHRHDGTCPRCDSASTTTTRFVSGRSCVRAAARGRNPKGIAGWPSVRSKTTHGAEAVSRAAKPPKGTLDTAEPRGLIRSRRPSCDRSIRCGNSRDSGSARMLEVLFPTPIDVTHRDRAHPRA